MLILVAITDSGQKAACKTRDEVCTVLKTGPNASVIITWEPHDKLGYIVAVKYSGNGEAEMFVATNSIDANLAFAGKELPKNPPLFGGTYDGVVFEPSELRACVVEYLAAAKERAVI